jgi:hypothetical protein
MLIYFQQGKYSILIMVTRNIAHPEIRPLNLFMNQFNTSDILTNY